MICTNESGWMDLDDGDIEQATEIAWGFEDSVTFLFDTFCTNGTCIDETESIANQTWDVAQANATNIAAEAGSQLVNETASTFAEIFLNDVSETFDVDVSNATSIVSSTNP